MKKNCEESSFDTHESGSKTMILLQTGDSKNRRLVGLNALLWLLLLGLVLYFVDFSQRLATTWGFYSNPEASWRVLPQENAKRSEEVMWLDEQAREMSHFLRTEGYQNFAVYHRLKSVKSAQEKADRKGITVAALNDYYGMRLVFQNTLDVYSAAAAISQKHEVTRWKDYILQPKASGYQSVHALVKLDGRAVEVQMRSKDMHKQAEAEHEAYKARMQRTAV